MKCPFCDSKELKVTDSRDSLEHNAIRRRRECLQCQKRFTTFETLDLSMQVHKRDGRYEEFDQKKLLGGIEAACRHTAVSRQSMVQIVSQITLQLMQRHTREVSSAELGELVMQTLRLIDPIAYIRFACVYQRLKDIDDLMRAVECVKSKDVKLDA